MHPHLVRRASRAGRTLGLLALVLSLPAAAFAQKHPITHEDVLTAKRIGAPVVSPDGKWAVFQVSEPAYDEKDQASDLWVVATDGSAAPRRLTATKGGERSPAKRSASRTSRRARGRRSGAPTARRSSSPATSTRARSQTRRTGRRPRSA